MSVFGALGYGILQGLTEFLPVSSSGHLALFQALFGVDDPGLSYLSFDILLHMGTLLAVFLLFWRDVVELIKAFFSLLGDLLRGRKMHLNTPYRKLVVWMILATLPLVLVVPLQGAVEWFYGSMLFIGLFLWCTAGLLWLADRAAKGKKTAQTMTWKDALFVGILQAFATLPGISRSGTTISAGRMRGLSKEFSVRFSFLLSIPAILGANVLSLDEFGSIPAAMVLPCIVGTVAAVAAGIAAIKLIGWIAKRGDFRVFRIYCLAAGCVAIVLSFL